MGELEICELKSSDERIKKEINNCHFVYCIAKAKDLVARCGKRPTPAPQTVRYVPVTCGHQVSTLQVSTLYVSDLIYSKNKITPLIRRYFAMLYNPSLFFLKYFPF